MSTDEEASWSDHTRSMRKALEECRSMYETVAWSSLPARTVASDSEAVSSFWHDAQNILDRRREALQNFWEPETPRLSEVDATNISFRAFRNEFESSNLPCLVRGLNRYFEPAESSWSTTTSSSDDSQRIHREWFLEQVGKDTVVPVRYQPESAETSVGVDSEGRAAECETKHMSLQNWIDTLDNTGDPSYYLKDWHLVSWLEEHAKDELSSLYQVPPLFSHDLLNAFLTRFTAGDYRFCYWGPAGSSTALHADVLNSFSWSYTVCGTKKWTFYAPPSIISDTAKVFEVQQSAGTCVFVPAGWTHEVVNVTESLSINHNWITTSSLDLAWDCINSELCAVETELKSWQADDMGWELHESMLRGCVGLDVTAFVLMMLHRAMELLQHEQDETETCYDLMRISGVLERLMNSDEELFLKNRLSSTLASGDAGAQVVSMMKEVVKFTKRLVENIH